MRPSHQAQSVLSERRIERLALGGGESVQRDGDATGDKLGHGASLIEKFSLGPFAARGQQVQLLADSMDPNLGSLRVAIKVRAVLGQAQQRPCPVWKQLRGGERYREALAGGGQDVSVNARRPGAARAWKRSLMEY
jgi:hypothetical protein